jgi:dienelactone hydrolase
MLTVLEMLIILVNIPVLVWALLPVKRVPRFLDFMPLAAVIFLILHLFIDNEPMRLRMIPLYIFTMTLFLITIKRIFRHNPDQPKRRILAAVGRLFGILVLTLSVLVPTVLLPFYSLPEPTGNFNVGTVVSDFTDKGRVETFSKEDGVPRKIAVQFWYPADKTGPKPQYDISGAPVSTSQPNYPVLIFSHGAFGVRNSNTSTFKELASQGYIVASIDHTYHSFYTSFADGKTVPISTQFLNEVTKVEEDSLPIEENFEITQNWLKVRTADIELVLNSLKSGELGAEGTVLRGHMDLTNIGLFGHSLGGAAAAELGREREDVKAAIVIDGTMIGDITGVSSDNTETITEERFTKPLMLMYGSLFQEPEAKATAYRPNIKAFNKATNAAYSLSIKDSGHLNFTDLPRISPFLSKKLGIGTIDSLECIKMVNAYSMAFFDKHLKGQPSALLEGTAGYEAVEFEKRIPEGLGY